MRHLMTTATRDVLQHLQRYGARVPPSMVGAWWALNARRVSRHGLN